MKTVSFATLAYKQISFCKSCSFYSVDSTLVRVHCYCCCFFLFFFVIVLGSVYDERRKTPTTKQQSCLIFHLLDLLHLHENVYIVNFQLINYNYELYQCVWFIFSFDCLFFFRTMEHYHAGDKMKSVFKVNHVFSKSY